VSNNLNKLPILLNSFDDDDVETIHLTKRISPFKTSKFSLYFSGVVASLPTKACEQD
jgi:hypothetical protein